MMVGTSLCEVVRLPAGVRRAVVADRSKGGVLRNWSMKACGNNCRVLCGAVGGDGDTARVDFLAAGRNVTQKRSSGGAWPSLGRGNCCRVRREKELLNEGDITRETFVAPHVLMI